MCTCHNYNSATKKFDFISPMIARYGCVKCQAYHYENDDFYTNHILYQSKHGIETVVNPQRRDYKKLSDKK